MATATMGGLRTLTLVLGAGYGGSYIYNNLSADNIRALVVDFMLPRDRVNDSASVSMPSLTRRAANQSTSAPMASADPGLRDLSAQVERLSRDVNRASSRPVVVVPAGSGDGASTGRLVAGARAVDVLARAGWTVVGLSVGSIVVYLFVCRVRNSVLGGKDGLLPPALRDALWVSRNTFNKTVEAVQESVSRVSASVADVRKELARKLAKLEFRVDNVRTGLSEKIETEVADVKECVDGVGRDVEGVKDMLHGVNDRMELLDGKLDTATTGIVALVRVVSSLAPMNVPAGSPFVELRRFAELAAQSEGEGATPLVAGPASMAALKAPQRKESLPSPFAAAALEGLTCDDSGGGSSTDASVAVISRRHSFTRPVMPPS